jgi:hypothetical protein
MGWTFYVTAGSFVALANSGTAVSGLKRITPHKAGESKSDVETRFRGFASYFPGLETALVFGSRVLAKKGFLFTEFTVLLRQVR